MTQELASPHQKMSQTYAPPQAPGVPLGMPEQKYEGEQGAASQQHQAGAEASAAPSQAGPSNGSAAPPAAPAPSKGKNGATGPAEGKPKPHVCPICQRGFTTGGHLQRHQRIHTGIKAFKCPYPGCETRTSRQDNLQQHYRTHLSPTLRRGSGTAARQAVAAAMMAAGLKSSNSRQPRKSKGSQVGTPGSSSGASVTHGQSPYPTPTQATAPYGGYMHDPTYGYPGGYPPIPPQAMANPQSAQSSRVPSPVNGHATSGGAQMPSAHHQQYFTQPFSPAYYQNSQYQQPYRYGPPGTMPYGAPHSQYYSPGMADHSQQHMGYPSMNTGFAQHSRDGQYSLVTPGGYASQAQMSNGYPRSAASSAPAAASEDDPRYRAGGAPRAPSPRRRLTSPQQANMLSAGVVDPSNMSTAGQTGVPPPYSYGANGYSYGSVHGRQSMSSEDGMGDQKPPLH